MRLTIDTSQPVNLREHLEGAVDDRSKILPAAVNAEAYVKRLLSRTIIYQEQVLKDLDYDFVQQLELGDPHDLALAMIIAEVDDIKQNREGNPQTATQILEDVRVSLSDRSCSDW